MAFSSRVWPQWVKIRPISPPPGSAKAAGRGTETVGGGTGQTEMTGGTEGIRGGRIMETGQGLINHHI